MTNKPIVYTGTISYGLYLLHKIPFDLAQAFHLDQYLLLALPLGLVASYAVAVLSWHLLEMPFLRLKRFVESTPRNANGLFVLAAAAGLFEPLRVLLEHGGAGSA